MNQLTQVMLVKRLLISLFLSLLSCLSMLAQVPTSLNGWYPNGTVNTITSDATHIYLGGNFTHVIKAGVAGALSRGAGVQTTGTGMVIQGFPVVNGDINVVIPDGTGGWYIGGSFTQVGGLTRNRIARINADKSVNTTWNPNANGTVWTIAISGMHLFVGGDFTNIGGQNRNRIAKISVTGTGTADINWNPNANSTVRTIAIGHSGTNLYVGGNFTSIEGQPRSRVARLSVTGPLTLDAIWNPNANGPVFTLLYSGLNVYAGGDFTHIGGQGRNRIARLASADSGSADTWNPNVSSVNSFVNTLALAGTDLYVGGLFYMIDGVSRKHLAKVSTVTGSIDNAWNVLVGSTVNALVVAGTDLYVGGFFHDSMSIGSQPGVERNRIAKVSTITGLVNTTWNPNTNGEVRALAISGTELYVGGTFNAIGGIERNRLVRIQKSDMELDVSWNPDANGNVWALTLSGTNLYVGGEFNGANSIGGQNRNHIAKLSTVGMGVADTDWNPNANSSVWALALSGTDLFIGGSFTVIGGQNRNHIAKLSTIGTGTVDADWNPDANGSIRALALSGTDLFTGGSFTVIGGQSRNHIAKLSTISTGSVDAMWNPNANDIVLCFAVSGTDLYVGGQFVIIGGQLRNRIAKISTIGAGLADTWNPGTAGGVSAVRALALLGTDLYAGGNFLMIGSQNRNRIGKVSTVTGIVAPLWNPGVDGAITNFSRGVCALEFSSGELYIGGEFMTVAGQSTPNFAVIGIQTPPTIFTTGTLSAFSTTYGTASATQTFTVSGVGLSAGITITAPAGFEVSANATTGFAGSITVGNAPTVNTTVIYVRLRANSTVTGGPYSGNITAASAGLATQNIAIPNSTVTPKELTITGISVDSKIYDGNATVITSGRATLLGVIAGDVVTLGNAGMLRGFFEFNDKNAGTNKPVVASNYAISGADAANYTLSLSTGLTANIWRRRSLHVTGLTAQNKIFDGNTNATITGTPVLSGVLPVDTGNVNLTGTPIGTFDTPAVGTRKIVTVSGLSLIGTEAGNYEVPLIILTASIIDPNAPQSALDSVMTLSHTLQQLQSTALANGRLETAEAVAVSSNSFKIYPNPTNGIFIVQGKQSIDGEAEVVISNMQGQVINRQSISGTQFSEVLDLSGITSGIYLLQIQQANGKIWTEKLVKE